MSRIQNILNKAERDGTVRRMRSMADGGNGTGVAVENPPAPVAPPPVMNPVPTAPPVTVAPPVAVAPPIVTPVTAPASGNGAAATAPLVAPAPPNGAIAHLAPTLVAALSPDAV